MLAKVEVKAARATGNWVQVLPVDDEIQTTPTFLGKDGKEHALVLNGLQSYDPWKIDNLGPCRIISCGERVCSVKPGDIIFFDHFLRTSTITLAGKDTLVIPEQEIRALLDENKKLHPTPDFILTKSAPERMRMAYTGSLTWQMLPEDFIQGVPCKLRSRAETVRKAERVLDLPPDWRKKCARHETPHHVVVSERVVYEEVVEMGTNWRNTGVKIGDLISVLTTHSQRVRIMGEELRLSQIGLSGEIVIDDHAIRQAAVRRGRMGKRILRPKTGLII